jgi:hypothetical protein
MTPDAESEMRQHLSRDERLLWAGRPRAGFLFRNSDFLVVPFSLLWGGFAVFWEVMALGALFAKGGNVPPLAFRLIFPLFGVPFVIVGLYLILGRFWVDKRQREKTVYGVTNERVLIHSGLFSHRLTSLSVRSLVDITLTENSDGSGSISFGSAYPFATWFQGMTWWPGASRFSGSCLDSIPRAKEVYDLIRKVHLESRQGTEQFAAPNAAPPHR